MTLSPLPPQIPQDGRTALHLAAFWGFCQALEALLGAEALVNATDKVGKERAPQHKYNRKCVAQFGYRYGSGISLR